MLCGRCLLECTSAASAALSGLAVSASIASRGGNGGSAVCSAAAVTGPDRLLPPPPTPPPPPSPPLPLSPVETEAPLASADGRRVNMRFSMVTHTALAACRILWQVHQLLCCNLFSLRRVCLTSRVLGTAGAGPVARATSLRHTPTAKRDNKGKPAALQVNNVCDGRQRPAYGGTCANACTATVSRRPSGRWELP